MTDTFRMFIRHVWVTMLTDTKFISFTVHNDARDGLGSMAIEIVEPWYTGHDSTIKQNSRTIIIDSEEKFNYLFKALMEMPKE